MVPATPALPQRQRDILGVLTGLLLLLGVFGVVMHGMESGDAARAITLPEVKPDVVEAPATTVTTAPLVGYVARDIGVSADFGGTPERITNDTTVDGYTIKATIYGLQRGDTLLLVGSTSVPKDDNSSFDDFAKGFARGFQSKLESSKALRFQGHEARDLTLRMNAGGMAHALLVRLDGRVVQVVVGAPTDPEAEYRAFLQTVRLL